VSVIFCFSVDSLTLILLFPTSPGCLAQRNRLHPLLAIQKGDRIVAVRSLEKARAARDFED